MTHPDTELRRVNDLIGYGVFATRLIPRGTLVWVADVLDQVFTAEQVAGLGPDFQAILDKYTYTDGKGRQVLCWDHARFFNHSCNANCLSAGYDFELAIRDILPDEELTDDYATLNLREPFACACLQFGCRGWIQPRDFERYADGWDALVRGAFPLVQSVPQPLWPFLRERAQVELALTHPEQLRSIRCNVARAMNER
jgi:hypothetical protein